MSTIGQLSTAIYRNMQILLGNRLANLDIKNGQYDFLYVISLEQGITQTQLSAHLRIGKSTTAKAVKNLVGKGYVEKRKSETDARVDHLYLTERGREIAPCVAEIFRENLSVAARGLSKAQQAQLLELMDIVLQNLVTENSAHAEGSTHE